MKKITFVIDELKYCRDILKIDDSTAKDVKTTLIVTGNNNLVDDFKIYDQNNNQKKYNDYNFFVRSCIFYQCFKYFRNEPCDLFGVVEIKEENF
ncbi:hypothetical protein H8S37_04420 [Mediterraneibacter sp. NSJ-55]|uniref:Uncharacterized protein n=1 Tax=Mediterraneibacter hominis TaxID=2763054 RepID=A0A923LH21_9FIRM|nr:hypothetical protein [Mediterraneibacter hominis]MBC5688178.1 hypothetical protein [Mediterraneibacter hominis]